MPSTTEPLARYTTIIVTAPKPEIIQFGTKPRVYPMRLYGDPVLRRKAKAMNTKDLSTVRLTVPGFEHQNIEEVANTMLETMFDQRGVGLAAPQIGLPVRMFVAVEYEDDEEENEGQEKPLHSRVLRRFVAINPKFKPLDKKKDRSYQEGCLSIPGIYEEGVPRARQISMTYTDLDGNEQVIESEDYLARVFQHEIDHLDGMMFLDRLPNEITSEYRKELLAIQQRSKSYLGSLQAWEKQQKES